MNDDKVSHRGNRRTSSRICQCLSVAHAALSPVARSWVIRSRRGGDGGLRVGGLANGVWRCVSCAAGLARSALNAAESLSSWAQKSPMRCGMVDGRVDDGVVWWLSQHTPSMRMQHGCRLKGACPCTENLDTVLYSLPAAILGFWAFGLESHIHIHGRHPSKQYPRVAFASHTHDPQPTTWDGPKQLSIESSPQSIVLATQAEAIAMTSMIGARGELRES